MGGVVGSSDDRIIRGDRGRNDTSGARISRV